MRIRFRKGSMSRYLSAVAMIVTKFSREIVAGDPKERVEGIYNFFPKAQKVGYYVTRDVEHVLRQ
jgi:hypothetical protein